VIIVQTPLRVSLFGGGTDFPRYYRNHGGCVLSTAIDKYIYVTIKRRFDQLLRVGYTKTEMVEQVDEIQHELIREALRKTGINTGIEITTMGDIPSAGSGLGSSSTVTVGAIHAMYAYRGQIIPAEILAQQACEIEIDTLGKPIGVQDQYIAAYGGLKFIEFQQDGSICVSTVEIDRKTKRKLDENLLLFYTGITRQSVTILKEQEANIDDREEVLNEMKGIAHRARTMLTAGDVDGVGELLHESWLLKKQLAHRVSNGEIDNAYQLARDAGALGGKITGAGGGGFLLVYCPDSRQEQVRESLRHMQELPFRLEPMGTKVIFNYQRD
jgi:D-glycero-alpha-D-manno-heptose-7-phosphate kinase